MGAGRSRRTGLILIVIILVVLLVAAGGLYLLQNLNQPSGGDTAQQQTEPPTPTPLPVLKIIVAAHDIQRGKSLSAADVTTLDWPLLDGSQPPELVLFVDEQLGTTTDQVDGRVARTDILAGEPILESMLTGAGEPVNLVDVGSDAAIKIPSGKVAIAVPVTRMSQVAYALREGDHVDVMMSFRFNDVDPDFQSLFPNSGIMVTDNANLAGIGLQVFPFTMGAYENGVFGTTILVGPSSYQVQRNETQADGSTTQINETRYQVPRQVTQLVISNVVVLRVGDWPYTDIDQPIVITVTPPPTETAPTDQGQAAAPAEPTAQPTPTAVPPAPDVLTLVMSRQDALVFKYSIEVGADIDLALRSAYDDDLEDVATDPVTLDYIINNRNVTVPDKLPVALDPRLMLVTNFADISAEVTPVAP